MAVKRHHRRHLRWHIVSGVDTVRFVECCGDAWVVGTRVYQSQWMYYDLVNESRYMVGIVGWNRSSDNSCYDDNHSSYVAVALVRYDVVDRIVNIHVDT